MATGAAAAPAPAGDDAAAVDGALDGDCVATDGVEGALMVGGGAAVLLLETLPDDKGGN